MTGAGEPVSQSGKGGKLKLCLRCATVATARCDGSVTLEFGARKLTYQGTLNLLRR